MARTLALGLLAAAAVWIAGEHHRGNCIDAGRRDCSVLPWNGGRAAAPATTTLTPEERREAEKILRDR